MHPRVKLVMLWCIVLYLTAIPASFILATKGDVSDENVDTMVGNDDDDDDCGHHGRSRHHHGGDDDCRCGSRCRRKHDDDDDDDDDDDGYTNSCTSTQVFYKGQCVECSSEIRNCINCEIQGDQIVCTACGVGFLEENGGACIPPTKSVVSKAANPVV